MALGPGTARSRCAVLAWLGTLATCVGAVVVASLAPQIPPDPEADEAVGKSAFYSLSADEPSMRKSAAKSFPTDPWSQDDDFHNQEFRRAQSLAGSNKVSVGSILRAADDGMHNQWSRASVQRPTVPPCRPRPIY